MLWSLEIFIAHQRKHVIPTPRYEYVSMATTTQLTHWDPVIRQCEVDIIIWFVWWFVVCLAPNHCLNHTRLSPGPSGTYFGGLNKHAWLFNLENTFVVCRVIAIVFMPQYVDMQLYWDTGRITALLWATGLFVGQLTDMTFCELV